VLGIHGVIGNAGGGDDEAFIGAGADIARRALIDAHLVHLPADPDDLFLEIGIFRLHHSTPSLRKFGRTLQA
jgi:hypothetical protein